MFDANRVLLQCDTLIHEIASVQENTIYILFNWVSFFPPFFHLSCDFFFNSIVKVRWRRKQIKLINDVRNFSVLNKLLDSV